jgi:hypothetical protein
MKSLSCSADTVGRYALIEGAEGAGRGLGRGFVLADGALFFFLAAIAS